MTRTISILGATGSIGRSTADVIQSQGDAFKVRAVVGGRDAAALAAVARALRAEVAVLHDEAGEADLKSQLSGTNVRVASGFDAVIEASAMECDVVVAAIAGTAGLAPTHAALKAGRRIALANKESLVCAGDAFMTDARRLGAEIMPVDSEHNALHQALGGGRIEDVAVMTLTASGGPFRTSTREALEAATPDQALQHPTWSMGAKVTIDSATLMNKGLELVEAHHLFGIPPERLDVLVHPQSIVHGLVHWRDGSVTAGLGAPDMRIPIANALRGAARLEMPLPRLDLAAIGSFTFEKPDTARFPCLALAQAALTQGGAMPAVLNAANEIAVAAFLEGRIGFYAIPALIESTCEAWLSRSNGGAPGSVAEALAINDEARRLATALLPTVPEPAT